MNQCSSLASASRITSSKNSSLNSEQLAFISKLVDNELINFMNSFGLNSGFDHYKAKILLKDDLEQVFIFLKNNINRIFAQNNVSGTYDYLTSLPALILGWIRFIDEVNLDQKLLERVEAENTLSLQYVRETVENIVSRNFKLPSVEDKLNVGKSKHIFSVNYELTSEGYSILDYFLKLEGLSIKILKDRIISIQNGIKDYN